MGETSQKRAHVQVQSFLDRERDPKTKILNTLLFSAFRIFIFIGTKSTLLEQTFFQKWVSKYPEFYDDFYSDRKYKKECTQKRLSLL
jgi:hypothetical protein